MLPVLLLAWLSILQSSSGLISCPIACRRCREQQEHPEMLEVYCAMCDECKQRRREWLQGAPSLTRAENSDDYLTNSGQQEAEDDCPPTSIDEPCDQPQRLTQRIPTTSTTITTTTTTTTSTTTTTRRPCTPKPCNKPTRPPCYSVNCIPMAIPVCPITCPVQMTGPFYTVTPPGVTDSKSAETSKGPHTMGGTASGLYFYLGVPKKLIRQLQMTTS